MPDRKLIDYLPPVLQSVMEFAAIMDTQQPAIDAAWAALDSVMNNQFIDTATEIGVSIWEKEIGIIPLSSDTLDDRKHRLKTALACNIVYTYNWLAEWLNASYGAGSASPSVKDYTLHVSLPISSDYAFALDKLRRQLPSNLMIDPTLLITRWKSTYFVGIACRTSFKRTIKTGIPTF